MSNLHFVQQFETRGIFRFVKLVEYVPQLRLQFQKQLERRGWDDVLLQLVTVVSCQGAQSAVYGHVGRWQQFGQVAMVNIRLSLNALWHAHHRKVLKCSSSTWRKCRAADLYFLVANSANPAAHCRWVTSAWPPSLAEEEDSAKSGVDSALLT